MQVERRSLSAIENELLFSKWCRRNGIEHFLFDGDDTVWATIEIFRRFMSNCCDYLALNVPALTRDEWEERMQEVNDAMFKTHSVNPIRWKYVMAEIARENVLLTSVKNRATEILMQIYQTPPRFLDGAEEGLGFIKRSGISFGVVTHANRHWTRQKYEWLQLSRFLDWDDVYVVDENGHKTEESWRQAIEYFHTRPERCAVVGDSPRSDINPASMIGVEHRFLIKNQFERWPIHDQPVAPGTVMIPDIRELIGLGGEYLIEYRSALPRSRDLP